MIISPKWIVKNIEYIRRMVLSLIKVELMDEIIRITKDLREI